MEVQPQGILVALGENWAKGKHGTRRALRERTVDTAIAADVLAQSGRFHTLIFSTGYTNGKNQIAEADAMADLVHAIDPILSQQITILRETISHDTPTNFREIQKLIAHLQLEGPITVVAPQFHLKRARRIAQHLHIPITTIATEKVLNLPTRPTPLVEYPLRALSLIDPDGRIPGLLTRRRMR
ncbi:MAG TPA: ElyC/SanA/YdcF family protein [Candidatus Eisenbacteria bacterium]|nr:ElyC/SanA/YdcF family protein [Candidatus Eisenbacteria bacterium]